MQVSEATCLSSLSYHEAWEMSYFGASVLHPRTTMPAMKYSIPITIRNFFNRESAGRSYRSDVDACFGFAHIANFDLTVMHMCRRDICFTEGSV